MVLLRRTQGAGSGAGAPGGLTAGSRRATVAAAHGVLLQGGRHRVALSGRASVGCFGVYAAAVECKLERLGGGPQPRAARREARDSMPSVGMRRLGAVVKHPFYRNTEYGTLYRWERQLLWALRQSSNPALKLWAGALNYALRELTLPAYWVEAAAWFLGGRDTEDVGSFEFVCQQLDLDNPAAVREDAFRLSAIDEAGLRKVHEWMRREIDPTVPRAMTTTSPLLY